MGKYLSFAWAVSFLAARGLLLFNTQYDWVLLIAGLVMALGLSDGEFESVAKYLKWQRKLVKDAGKKD